MRRERKVRCIFSAISGHGGIVCEGMAMEEEQAVHVSLTSELVVGLQPQEDTQAREITRTLWRVLSEHPADNLTG